MLIFLMLVGCSSNKTVEDKIVMVDWEYGQMKIAPGAQIVKVDGVTFVDKQGATIRPEEIKSEEWITIKKINPDGGWFSIISPAHALSRVRLLKGGEKECPPWAIGMYPLCETIEFEVHGNN